MMSVKFVLEYWKDDGWFVGRLKEVPGVFSQGETLEDLIENIRDAYSMIMSEQKTMSSVRKNTYRIPVTVNV